VSRGERTPQDEVSFGHGKSKRNLRLFEKILFSGGQRDEEKEGERL